MDVDFDLREGRVWIDSRIQGESARAIFDTGSDGTAVDIQFATDLGLPPKGEVGGSTVAGEMGMVRSGPAKLAIGARELATDEVVLLPLASHVPGLQAILGFDVLREFPFTLDYGRRCIRLDSMPDGQGLPFVVEDDIRPTTWLAAHGARFKAHIDTGSSQGVSLPLEWVESNVPNILGEETRREILENMVTARQLRLDRMRLGDLELEEVQGEAVSAGGGSFAAQGALWANIGNAVLKRCRVGIDGRSRVSVFELAK